MNGQFYKVVENLPPSRYVVYDSVCDSNGVQGGKIKVPYKGILVHASSAVPLEEHPGIDYPGNDLEDLPCSTMEEARGIAQQKIGGDADKSAAWCSARQRIWIKRGASQDHPSKRPGHKNPNV